MAVTATSGIFDTPERLSIALATGSASGVINKGDWLAYSGQAVFATNAGHTAFWKASGAGVAIESNPTYDQWGRIVTASALLFVREGILRVSADFSGVIPLGIGAYPDATGSGVAAPTGATGLGATWQTGVKLPLALTGNTGAGGSGVALVVGYRAAGNGGTGQMDVLLTPPRPDFY